MADYTGEPLGPQTWDAYARMTERHNGVFGGCWCTYFDGTRALDERLGFTYVRPKGLRNCVMRTTVAPVRPSAAAG